MWDEAEIIAYARTQNLLGLPSIDMNTISEPVIQNSIEKQQ